MLRQLLRGSAGQIRGADSRPPVQPGYDHRHRWLDELHPLRVGESASRDVKRDQEQAVVLDRKVREMVLPNADYEVARAASTSVNEMKSRPMSGSFPRTFGFA
jgi:hypothetical protein